MRKVKPSRHWYGCETNSFRTSFSIISKHHSEKAVLIIWRLSFAIVSKFYSHDITSCASFWEMYSDSCPYGWFENVLAVLCGSGAFLYKQNTTSRVAVLVQKHSKTLGTGSLIKSMVGRLDISRCVTHAETILQIWPRLRISLIVSMVVLFKEI
jgi:hypothetical protein